MEARIYGEIQYSEGILYCIDLENGARYLIDSQSSVLLEQLLSAKAADSSAKYCSLLGGIYLLDGEVVLQIDSVLAELSEVAVITGRHPKTNAYEYYLTQLIKSQLSGGDAADLKIAPGEPLLHFLSESSIEKIRTEVFQALRVNLDPLDGEEHLSSIGEELQNSLNSQGLEMELTEYYLLDTLDKTARYCNVSSNLLWKDCPHSQDKKHSKKGLQRLLRIKNQKSGELIHEVPSGMVLSDASYQLQGHWLFDHFSDTSIFFLPGTTPLLSFNLYESSVNGFSGCNKLFGQYRISEDSISFQALATTQKFCSESSEIEAHLLKTLGNSSSFRVNDCYLELENTEGTAVVFRRSLSSTVHD